jgi:hypothetical protein
MLKGALTGHQLQGAVFAAYYSFGTKTTYMVSDDFQKQYLSDGHTESMARKLESSSYSRTRGSSFKGNI